MSYSVKLTDYAASQIAEITAYISQDLREPETARRWAIKLKAELKSLDELPSRFGLVEEEPWKTQGIRKLIVKNFIAYYLVDNVARNVWITAVLRGTRSTQSSGRYACIAITTNSK